MKKHLFALLALLLLVAGCPSGDAPPKVDAATFEAGLALDASIDAASPPHRLGSFNPTCTASGVPRVVGGVQQSACTLGTGLQVLRTNAGATDVEWATPSGGSVPTGTGFEHVTAGALDGTSKKVDLTASADVTVPATANGVVTSSGTVLQQAANVLAGTDFVSVAASPASAGNVRLASGGTIKARSFSGAADLLLLGHIGSAAENILIGENNNATQGDVFIRTSGSQTVRMTNGAAGNFILAASSTNVLAGVPIIGDPGQPSVYGVHGKTTVATAPPFTLTAASYSLDAIMLSNAGAGTVTFPAPADDAHAYYKTVINTGAGTKTLTDGGASTPTLAVNLSGRYLCDTAGMHLTGPSVAYP